MRVFFLMAGLSAAVAAEPEAFDRLTFHGAAKALAEGAVTAEWPRLLGPTNDCHSPERPLLKEFTEEEPRLVWEVAMGEGYTAPAVVEGRVILFHAQEGNEVVECVAAETGRRYWRFEYPFEYRDRYGFAAGPRGGPVETITTNTKIY